MFRVNARQLDDTIHTKYIDTIWYNDCFIEDEDFDQLIKGGYWYTNMRANFLPCGCILIPVVK